jgi:hypothetical protein
MSAATVVVPSRSNEQRMDALALANRIRVYRAKTKREIKRGEKSIASYLRSTPAEMESMKVLDLLLAAPKVGRVKAMKAINYARISPSKTLGGLSTRQRSELLAMLRLS